MDRYIYIRGGGVTAVYLYVTFVSNVSWPPRVPSILTVTNPQGG